MFTTEFCDMYYADDDQNRKQLDALKSVHEKAMGDPVFARQILDAVNSRSASAVKNCNTSSNPESSNAQSSADKRNRLS